MMEILEYILAGAFVILLIMYVIKARIDSQFRKKMVPLLKKQKETIKTIENERNLLSDKNRDLIRELNIAKNKLSKQDQEYNKIEYILSKGLFIPVMGLSKPSKNNHAIDKRSAEQSNEEISNIANLMKLWFKYKYTDHQMQLNSIEATNILQKYAEQLTTEFSSKKLSFICHLGEPIHVIAHEAMLVHSLLSYGRLLGKRSMTGNTIYIDTDKTGKKCLISMEESGPGDHDIELKSLFTENWAPDKIQEWDNSLIIPVLLAREFVTLQEGNTWIGKVQEIGIKITFSLQLDK